MTPRYFIHLWRDIGANFLCETVGDQIWVHGEQALHCGKWYPVTDAGEPYEPRKIQDQFNDDLTRFQIVELNQGISPSEFEQILTKVKAYHEPE